MALKANKKGWVRPESWYNLSELVEHAIFPWATSFWSVRKIIAEDRKNKNYLKAVISGAGSGTKYHLKGKNIIKFLEAFEK